MKKYTLFALTVFAATLVAGAPLRAATLMVTSTADDGGAGELRAAINTMNADGGGDTITFQPGLSGTIVLTSVLPVLTADVTIQGNASPTIAIDGAGQFRVFNVYDYGGTVSISNLTIQNGSDSVDNNGGGGIFVNQATTLHISNCTLTGNSGKNGGALSSSGTTTLTNCLVTSNTAQGGGGVFSDLATLTLTDCTLSMNTCSNFGGGAININGNSTGVITDCTIEGNSCTTTGGGLINFSNATLTNCTLYNNTAQVGGAIANEFPGTSPAIATVVNCTISGNNASEFGAGIRNDGNVTLTNTILYGDTVDELSGNQSGTGSATHCDIQGGIGSTTTVTDAGGNTSADPLLDALADNGGEIDTMALGDGSPCLGAGTTTGAPTTDARGITRPSTPSIGAYDIAAAVGHTFPAGLTMLSVPTDYSGDPLASVLGYSNPKLAVWNPSSNTYSVTPTAPADALRIGQGYWLRVPAGGASITTLGSPGPTNWTINLVPGWNMIGDPLPTPIALSSLDIVDSSNVAHTFAEASYTYPGTAGNLNLVEDPFYTFQPGDTQYEAASGATGSLKPYYGYWVYANEDCTLEPAPAVSSPFAGTYSGTDDDTLMAFGQTITNTIEVPTLTIASDGTVTGSDQYGSLTGTIDPQGNVNLHIDASLDGYTGTAIVTGVLSLSNEILSGTLNGSIQTSIGTATSTDVLQLTKQ